MFRRNLKILFILLFIGAGLQAQNSEISFRINVGELKMTFPSIYFKHNSTGYAEMPYSVDSCLKYYALHMKDISGRPIWRDSLETEQLNTERIKKIKNDLKKYSKAKLDIRSMHEAQKISRRSINLGVDSAQVDYLLSLNSVFDIAKTRFPKEQKKHFRIGSAFDLASIKHKQQLRKKDTKPNEKHILHPKIWCGNCWKNGFHLNKRGRDYRKTLRHNQKSEAIVEKKKERHIPRLVWTGWKTGFHWSTAGKTNKR